MNDRIPSASARFVLDEDELKALTAHALKRSFPRNAVIVNEGDRTDTLYVILEGRVKVYTGDADGREVVLSTHGPGEYFGEMIRAEPISRRFQNRSQGLSAGQSALCGAPH